MTTERLTELRAIAATAPQLAKDLTAAESWATKAREEQTLMSAAQVSTLETTRTAYTLAVRAGKLVAEYEGKE